MSYEVQPGGTSGQPFVITHQPAEASGPSIGALDVHVGRPFQTGVAWSIAEAVLEEAFLFLAHNEQAEASCSALPALKSWGSRRLAQFVCRTYVRKSLNEPHALLVKAGDLSATTFGDDHRVLEVLSHGQKEIEPTIFSFGDLWFSGLLFVAKPFS